MEALLKLILHKNCFFFNGKYYLQTTGVAMGQKCAPEPCDIMFLSLEKKFISLSDKIFKWYRYRDDIICFWSGYEHELANFISRINTMHPTLKFTHEWSKTEIHFLDLTLYKGERFKNTQILDINASVKLVTHFNIFLEIHLTQMHAFQAWSKVRPFVIFETLVQRLNMSKN